MEILVFFVWRKIFTVLLTAHISGAPKQMPRNTLGGGVIFPSKRNSIPVAEIQAFIWGGPDLPLRQDNILCRV